jgi:hypothetical protein
LTLRFISFSIKVESKFSAFKISIRLPPFLRFCFLSLPVQSGKDFKIKICRIVEINKQLIGMIIGVMLFYRIRNLE